MPDSDFSQRFIFEHQDVRGCITRLSRCCPTQQKQNQYPMHLSTLINALTAVAVLLQNSLKNPSDVSVQLQAQGALNLVVADCLQNRTVRAMAKHTQSYQDTPIALNTLDGNAILTININAKESVHYQSIIPLEHADLASCLTQYFTDSEQLPSKFVIYADHNQASAIALHALPLKQNTSCAQRSDFLQHAQFLLQTLPKEEAFSLSSQALLYRLFHQDHCRIFEKNTIHFGCTCSKDKFRQNLQNLGEKEIRAIFNEQKKHDKQHIETQCHFCQQIYMFSESSFIQSMGDEVKTDV